MKRNVHTIINTIREIKRMGERIGCDFTPDDKKLRGFGLTDSQIKQVRLLIRDY